MLKLIAASLLVVAATHAVCGVEMSNPKEGEKYYVRCAQMNGLGTAAPGERVTFEIVNSGVVQGRKTVIANEKGVWIAEIKIPHAGWIQGEALANARIGKDQKSVKVRFVELK